MTNSNKANGIIISLDQLNEEESMNILQTYMHKIAITDNNGIQWRSLLVAHMTIMTTDNWSMGGFKWSYKMDKDGYRTTILEIQYIQLPDTAKRSKCPAQTKLELIKLGYFPLDKLKEVSRTNKDKE